MADAAVWKLRCAFRARKAVADPEAVDLAEDEVGAIGLLLEDQVDRPGGEELDDAPVGTDRAAAVGNDGLNPGHRSGVPVAVGGPDLGSPPRLGPRHIGRDDRGLPGEEVGKRCRVRIGLNGLGRDDVADPVVVDRVEADVEVGAERACDLVGEEPPEGPPIDSPYQLADEMALVQRVVSRSGSRLPTRCLRCELRHGPVPVIEVVEFERCFPERHPRGVCE